LVGVDAGCFLVAGGATTSESELELLDEAALRLTDWADATTLDLTGCFLTSASEESEEEVSCFFLMLLFS
jgi:hypothetical protein